MVDAWQTHCTLQINDLENKGKVWCPDMSGLEHFADKTLIWYDPVNAVFCKNELIQIAWSLEYGCNTVNKFAYVEELTLGFVGIPQCQENNYAYRQNTALCIRERSFHDNPDILRTAFLGQPFGTILPHPFAQEHLPSVPFANISHMIVIDKHFDKVSEHEFNDATEYLQQHFDNIPKAEILKAARLAAVWSSARSDPMMLKGI
jgi:hypothetical protein